MLHVVFTLDRDLNLFVAFEVNKALYGIFLCEARNQSVPVLVDPPNKSFVTPTYKMPLRALARI
jgi:hypothetical protein